MSTFLLVTRSALYVLAGLLAVGAGVTVAVAVDAWRTGGRHLAWSLAGLLVVTACVIAGLIVAAGYVR